MPGDSLGASACTCGGDPALDRFLAGFPGACAGAGAGAISSSSSEEEDSSMGAAGRGATPASHSAPDSPDLVSTKEHGDDVPEAIRKLEANDNAV